MNTLETVVSLVLGLAVLAAWFHGLEKAGYSTTSALGMALLLVIPVVNLGVIVYFVMSEWPIQREVRLLRKPLESRTEQDAFTLYCQGSRLEAQGKVEAALAKYEEAIAASPESEAAHDAEASIRTLRAGSFASHG